MFCTACHRVLAAFATGLIALAGMPAGAEQSGSVGAAPQTAPPVTTVPPIPVPNGPPPPTVAPPPMPLPPMPLIGGAAPTVSHQTRSVAPGLGETPTPAQQKYGLPKLPIVGGPVDMDLSKPLSVQRAIQIGLARQNSIAIAQTQADASQGRLTQARSSFFPQVTPTFQFQTNLQPGGSFIINGQRIAGGSARSENRTEVVAARQLIFDTGRREANVGVARRSLFASEYGLGNQRQDVVLAVTSSYFNLLRDRELVRVQQESVRRAEETAASIEAAFVAGTAAKADTLQAQADLANARVALLTSENNYRLQEAALKNAMGVVTNSPLVLDDTLPPTTTAADTIPLEKYVQTAYANRLDVKQQQERVYAQGYNVKVAQINAGLSLQADVTEGYQFDPTAGEQRTFIVSATYPLFDAGNARAVVRENKANWESEKRTLDQLQQNVRLNVDQSFTAREEAKQRQLAANLAVIAATENYKSAAAKNKEGLINILEVINAEVLLVNAEVQQVQAVYDFRVADAQLLRDIGLNDPVYLPRVPNVKPPVQPRP